MPDGDVANAKEAAPAEIDLTTRSIHLALVAFGVLALVSGQFAGDYKSAQHSGFDIHRWCGLGMALVIAVRGLWGLAGPRKNRFSAWFPLARARLLPAWQDIVALTRLTLPSRPLHQGLAGLVQMLGLFAFAWMAVSGAILFAWLVPGSRATGAISFAKELHEGGQVIVWAYLALHVGAVVAHALAGHDLWRRMFFVTQAKEKRQ